MDGTCNVCVTSGFRHELDVNCSLLSYYSASSGNFLNNFQYNLAVPSAKNLRFLALKMGPRGCTKTSVRSYYYSLGNNPEERSSLTSNAYCGAFA